MLHKQQLLLLLPVLPVLLLLPTPCLLVQSGPQMLLMLAWPHANVLLLLQLLHQVLVRLVEERAGAPRCSCTAGQLVAARTHRA